MWETTFSQVRQNVHGKKLSVKHMEICISYEDNELSETPYIMS